MAERGEHEPFIAARYRIHGLHPDAVFPAIMAMRRAKLGNEFSDWFDQAGNLKPACRARNRFRFERQRRVTVCRLLSTWRRF